MVQGFRTLINGAKVFGKLLSMSLNGNGETNEEVIQHMGVNRTFIRNSNLRRKSN